MTDDQYPLEIRCPNQRPLALTDISAGADLVTLPCACSITYASMTLVAARIMCDAFIDKALKIHRTVPLQWTGRAAPRFSVLAEDKEIPVSETELKIHEESEVTLTEDGGDVLPRWIVETIAAVVGAIVGSAIAALSALFRRWCGRRRLRRSPRPREDVEMVAVGREPPARREPPTQRDQPVIPVRNYLLRGDTVSVPLRRPPPVPRVVELRRSTESQYLNWHDLK